MSLVGPQVHLQNFIFSSLMNSYTSIRQFSCAMPLQVSVGSCHCSFKSYKLQSVLFSCLVKLQVRGICHVGIHAQHLRTVVVSLFIERKSL